MHCHCGTNNKAPQWTFMDPCKPEVRPGAREESASPAWLAAPAMNARDTTKVYIWRLDTGCGPTLYRKCHSHNTPGKRHNNTWVEPLAGNCTTSSTRQREQVINVLHIGIYLCCTNSKETHKSCACFQHAITRSGRKFGRVCTLKTSTGPVCLFAICTILIYIPICNIKQYIYQTKYAVLCHSRTCNNQNWESTEGYSKSIVR